MHFKEIDKNVIKQVVDILVKTAHPSKIILFGSGARNQMTEESDMDLIVVEKEVQNKGQEMVRLRNAIGNIGIGVDLLVYSQKEIEEWGHLPGTALYEGLKEGKTIYEATH